MRTVFGRSSNSNSPVTVWALRLLAVWCGGVWCSVAGAANTATDPVPRSQEWWQERHNTINGRTREGDVELAFLGDSITQGWNNNAVWQKYYGHRKAANMGIGGDRTQHVLWRLDNGNIDGISPKLAVLMIGTNNSNGTDNTAEEIGAGITQIVARLREKLPHTKVLVLGIFPRGETPNPQREKNASASRIAAETADGEMVHYLDIGDVFLEDDGRLTKEIMPDFLHLSLDGYARWAAAIEPHVAKLLGDTPVED